MFWIEHKRAQYRRDPITGAVTQVSRGVAGMSTNHMLEWVEKYKDDFTPDSFLLFDNLRSHVNEDVQNALRDAGITPRPFPVKGALLLSPLDNGFFSEYSQIFKTNLQERPPDQKWRKWNAACYAYDHVPSHHV